MSILTFKLSSTHRAKPVIWENVIQTVLPRQRRTAIVWLTIFAALVPLSLYALQIAAHRFQVPTKSRLQPFIDPAYSV